MSETPVWSPLVPETILLMHPCCQRSVKLLYSRAVRLSHSSMIHSHSRLMMHTQGPNETSYKSLPLFYHPVCPILRTVRSRVRGRQEEAEDIVVVGGDNVGDNSCRGVVHEDRA